MSTDTIIGAILFANAMVFAAFSAIVITSAILIINNLIHKYWKPIKFISFDYTLYDLKMKELENERTQQSSGPQEDRTSLAGNQQQPDKK